MASHTTPRRAGAIAFLMCMALNIAAAQMREPVPMPIGADHEQDLGAARLGWLALADAEEEKGHYIAAERALRIAAELGDLRALERLGLMHWIGKRLYGAGPWSRAEGAALLRQAAVRGSAVGRAMARATEVAQRDDR